MKLSMYLRAFCKPGEMHPCAFLLHKEGNNEGHLKNALFFFYFFFFSSLVSPVSGLSQVVTN